LQAIVINIHQIDTGQALPSVSHVDIVVFAGYRDIGNVTD